MTLLIDSMKLSDSPTSANQEEGFSYLGEVADSVKLSDNQTSAYQEAGRFSLLPWRSDWFSEII